MTPAATKPGESHSHAAPLPPSLTDVQRPRRTILSTAGPLLLWLCVVVLSHRFTCAAAEFCETTGFTDMDITACVPKIARFESGQDFIRNYVTYKECNGLAGDDCSNARAFLFSSMNCTECGSWADIAAFNEANCTSHTDQEACVGVAQTGHVYTEELGTGKPGAVVPVSDLQIVGDYAYDEAYAEDAAGYDADSGVAVTPAAALDAPGVCRDSTQRSSERGVPASSGRVPLHRRLVASL